MFPSTKSLLVHIVDRTTEKNVEFLIRMALHDLNPFDIEWNEKNSPFFQIKYIQRDLVTHNYFVLNIGNDDR
jgi:hypothetical protein